MAYRPGSFSKNFAWHGTGLRKLHEAIRKGFGGHTQPVTRDSWRRACGIDDADLELIPLNFFLHNSIVDGTNYVSVDELVLQAISGSHSAVFDQLALFALNLSRGGARKGRHKGEARPAGWANEFVCRYLWKGGAWRKEALGQANVHSFLEGQLDATPAVRRKVLTNYRHIFELCGYLKSGGEAIETAPASWGVSAAYLMWDRLTLDGELSPTASIETLKREALRGDFHKLLGTTEANGKRIVEAAAPLYVEMGRLARTNHAPPQLRRLTEKIGSGARARYGDTEERAQRTAILSRIAALERELERIRPVHGGIGHNNPPQDKRVDEAQEAVGAIKEELKKEEPDAPVVGQKTSVLQTIIGWCADKADKFVDSFVQTFGKVGALAVVAWWPAVADQIRSLVTLLTRWLSMIIGSS